MDVRYLIIIFILLLCGTNIPIVSADFHFPFAKAYRSVKPKIKAFHFPTGSLSFSLTEADDTDNLNTANLILTAEPSSLATTQKLQISFIPSEQISASNRYTVACLFDISSSMGEYIAWHELLEFIRELVDYQKTDIDLNFIFYADTATVFPLSNHQEKSQLHTYLQNLSPQGGTNLELAFMTLGQYTEHARQKVQRVLLFSDGQPTLGKVDFPYFQNIAQTLLTNLIQLDVFYTGYQNPPPILNVLTETTGGTIFNFSALPRQLLAEIQSPLTAKAHLRLYPSTASETSFFIALNSSVWKKTILLTAHRQQKLTMSFELSFPTMDVYQGECEF